MAQTRWQTHFKAARYGPVVDTATGVRTLIDPGDLGAGDLIGHEVRHYLANDPIIRRIFKDRIEFMPWRNLIDFRVFPRLGVYLASSLDSERPTSVAVEDLSVYVTAWWDAQQAEVVKDGEMTIATVLAHEKRVLRSDKARTLIVSFNGEERSLSSESVTIAGERFATVQLPSRLAFINELQFNYQPRLDRSGVVLLSLAA